VSGPRRVLQLVSNPSANSLADFEELAQWIAELDSELAVSVVSGVSGADHAAQMPDLPTL